MEHEVMMTEPNVAYRMGPTTIACCLALGACAFPDPNTPPAPDPVLVGLPAPPARGQFYTVKIDGVPGCPDSPRPDDEDTILVFTGPDWNEQSVLRRAQDAFFGVIAPGKPVTADAVHVDDPIDDAIGYCLVNAGTGTEIAMFSVCGQRGPGKTACEQTLAKQANMKGLTATWHDCPGDGERCPKRPEEPCVMEGGDGKSYAAYIDIGPIVCGENGQPDDRDTLLVTTRGAFTLTSAACMTQWPYAWGVDVGAAHSIARGSYQPERAPFIHSGMRDGFVVQGSGTLELPRVTPLGYCLIHEGEEVEYVLYSFCDQVSLPSLEQAESNVAQQWLPEAMCAGLSREGRSVTASPRSSIEELPDADGGVRPILSSTPAAGRPSRWVSCMGEAPGPLCF